MSKIKKIKQWLEDKLEPLFCVEQIEDFKINDEDVAACVARLDDYQMFWNGQKIIIGRTVGHIRGFDRDLVHVFISCFMPNVKEMKHDRVSILLLEPFDHD